MRYGMTVCAALLFSSAACDPDIGIVTYDNAPVAAIKQPFDGAIFSEGETITFVGKLADDRPVEELGTVWISDLDQNLTDEVAPDPDRIVSLPEPPDSVAVCRTLSFNSMWSSPPSPETWIARTFALL